MATCRCFLKDLLHNQVGYFPLNYSASLIMRILKLPRRRQNKVDDRSHSFLALCGALGVCLILAQQLTADSMGDYALTDFTDEPPGFPAGSPDGGTSLILTGGENGSGIGGVIDLAIQAAADSQTQFNWSYLSDGPSSSPDPQNPQGCGLNFLGLYEDAGCQLGGTYHQMVDDVNQGTDLGVETWTFQPLLAIRPGLFLSDVFPCN